MFMQPLSSDTDPPSPEKKKANKKKKKKPKAQLRSNVGWQSVYGLESNGTVALLLHKPWPVTPRVCQFAMWEGFYFLFLFHFILYTLCHRQPFKADTVAWNEICAFLLLLLCNVPPQQEGQCSSKRKEEEEEETDHRHCRTASLRLARCYQPWRRQCKWIVKERRLWTQVMWHWLPIVTSTHAVWATVISAVKTEKEKKWGSLFLQRCWR